MTELRTPAAFMSTAASSMARQPSTRADERVNQDTLAAQLLRSLRDAGARAIFGIPGDFALPLFRIIEETGILPLHTLSHEPSVGFAADAAARMGGGLGVVAVTYGAGALNVVNAVAAAYAERSPLIVVSAAPSRAERLGGLLVHHQVRTHETQLRIFEEITCQQAIIDDPAMAPRLIADVIRTCLDRSLPGYIEIPRDLAEALCGPITTLPPDHGDAEAAQACAADILARLQSARTPVVMVGVEVRRHGLEGRVAELARRLGVPVVTSFMRRGLLSGPDSPVRGTYLGLAGRSDIRELVEGADLLILLGVILSDTNFGVSGKRVDLRRAIHAFDRQVRIGYSVYPNVPLATLTNELLAQNPGRSHAVSGAAACYPSGLPADNAAIQPIDIAMAVNDLLRAHGPMPIASDVGDCLFTAMEIDHMHLVAPGYYAGMGFGVPAGLGVQATTGERPLVLVGDGAFQMTGWELGNCRRYGWDPIVLVLNNRSWGMLRAFAPEASFTALSDWHYADIAASLGGAGRRVSTRAELKHALEAAHEKRGRFQLIEVSLDQGAISDTLAHFVDTAARRTARDAGA